MAIKQTISLEGLQTVQNELKSLADVGTATFARIGAAVHGSSGGLETFAANILNIGKAMTSLTGALAVFGGITAGLVGLTVSASNAGEEFENLSKQLGTTVENASALLSAFARTGTDVQGLAQQLRRAAVNISSEWATIQKSISDAGTKTIANNIAVQQSINNVAKAEIALANQEKNAALQRQANAQGVADARTRLDDLLEQRRIREGGERDIELENERARERERQEIAKARLALEQQEQKEKEEAAQAEIKANEAALAAESAQLARTKAREQAAEDQKNSIENLVGFVNELSAGLTNTGRQVNATVDNIFKGIVASVGLAGKSIGEIDISKVVSPDVFAVLLKLSDALKNMTSETEKSALASKTLGRQVGAEEVAFLSKGSEAVKAYIEEVKKLGLEMSGPMIERLQEFRRQLFTLQNAFSTIKNQLGSLFAPVFGPFFETLSNLLIQNRLLFLSWAETLINTVKPTLDSIIRVLSGETKPEDKWLLDIIESFKKFGTTIRDIVVPAFKSIIDIAGAVAKEINSIFGTNLDAASGIFILWLTTILGGFRILGAALKLITTGFTVFATAAGIALAPLLALTAAIAAGFLIILAAVDKATFEGVKQLGADLVDLGKKVFDNFGKSAAEGTDKTEISMAQLEEEARKLGESGKKSGTEIAAGQAVAQQALQKTTQEAVKAKTGIDATFFKAPAPGVSGFDLLPKVGEQRVALDQRGALIETRGEQIQQQTQTQAQSAVQAFQAASDEIIRIWNSLRDAIDAVDFSGLFEGLSDELTGPFLDAEESIIAVFDAIAQEAEQMAQRVGQAAQQAATALQQISSGGGFGGEFAGGFAGGGRVSGPGSWTSDSILARLSRDEFVQPAFRVHQYGMDFMEAIRRGLLSTDAVRALMGDFRGLRFGGSAFPRFAEGGAVTSGGSRTLNLILGGQTFPVSGSAKVIDSLEREAALRSIASTGIAQSFVGRR